MKPLPFPVLVADIGGTNARIAIVEDDTVGLPKTESFKVSDHEGLSPVVRQVIEATGIQPRSFFLAIAGPPHAEPIALINGHWTFEPEGLIEEFGLEEVLIVNDFAAQAAAIPKLDASELMPIGKGKPDPNAPIVVIGPGTGLGVAFLLPSEGRFTVLPGEGGNLDLGPRDGWERKFWEHLENPDERVSQEMLVSGRGLEAIHAALERMEGRAGSNASAAEITDAASKADDPALAKKACRLFWSYLARYCGDLALLVLARGGVMITGGVARHLAPHIDVDAFRSEFENKIPYEPLLEVIPVSLISSPEPGMTGLCAIAREPDLYDLHLAGRKFCR